MSKSLGIEAPRMRMAPSVGEWCGRSETEALSKLEWPQAVESKEADRGVQGETLPLFAGQDLPLEAISASSLNSYVEYLENIWQSGDRFFVLIRNIIALDYERFYQSLQLPLFNMQPSRPAVTHLIPRSSHICLDYGVTDTFRYSRPEVRAAAQRLGRKNLPLLGNLIQLCEEEILRFPFMSEDILHDMRTTLAQYGLSFGASIPWWNRGLQSSPRLCV